MSGCASLVKVRPECVVSKTQFQEHLEKHKYISATSKIKFTMKYYFKYKLQSILTAGLGVEVGWSDKEA